MEKSFFKYIDYLLPIHNYIIIPDLGAFIMNMEDASILESGEIYPPLYIATFNSDITHNDGILSSYIIKNNNISYRDACNQIKEYVKTIKNKLKKGEVITCGGLGSLEMDSEGRIIFKPNENYKHPNFIGLSHTGIKRIEDINRDFLKEKKYLSLKYITGGIAAASVALLLFIAPSINIKNSDNNNAIQKADFLSTITHSLSDKKNESSTVNFPLAEVTINKDKESNNEVTGKPARIYYIIVGGEDSRNKANNLLEKFKTEDFPNANIVETSDRYRIYVASFYNKNEAESFLEDFRKEHPKYESAWLFSKRNN